MKSVQRSALAVSQNVGVYVFIKRSAYVCLCSFIFVYLQCTHFLHTLIKKIYVQFMSPAFLQTLPSAGLKQIIEVCNDGYINVYI